MRRRNLVAALVAMLIGLGAIAPQFAASAPRGDPRAEREQVRAEKARVASQIDTTKASVEEIDDALQAINENYRTQEAALTRTEGEVAQAEKDIADAEGATKRLAAQIVILRRTMRQLAVRAYVNPPADDVLTVLDTKDFTTASSRKFYIELRSQDDADIADRLDGAQADLAFQRRKATEAKKRAESKRAEQARRTDAVAKAKAEQQRIADSLEGSLDSQITRSLALDRTDRKLSAEIADQAAKLQARLLAQKALAAEALANAQAVRDTAAAQASAQAAAQAAAPKPRPSSGSGSSASSRPTSSPSASSSPPASLQKPNGGEAAPLPAVSSSGSGVGTGGIKLCTVGGITINCAIEAQVSDMVNAAAADGVRLSGGGYRDPAQQIELRKQHCGTSYYAIYQMSSGSCRPPTAIPGSSQHELGLAIDFSNCSRGSASFGWLKANAGSYGFYNLPSESWHWSTTGH